MNKDRWLSSGIILLAALSLIGAAFFFHIYLERTAEQFAQQFYRQNLSEISNGDTLALTSRLNSMAGIEHFNCVVGSKDGAEFFRQSQGACREALWVVKRSAVNPAGPDTRVDFYMELPQTLNLALWSFLIAEFLSFALIGYILRRLRIARYEVQAQQSIRDLAIWRERMQHVQDLGDQIAHDIRSPLSALRVAGERIADPEAQSLSRKALARMDDIVDSFKLKSLVGANENRFAPVLALTEEIVNEKKAHLHLKQPATHIELMCALKYDSVLNIPVTAYKRMISNILNNSIESMPEGKGRIEIQLDQVGSTIGVEVRDTGRGIPPQVLAKLDGQKLSYGKAGGNGLGLFHAHAVLKYWGGKIRIDSAENQGTSIRLEGPARELAAT